MRGILVRGGLLLGMTWLTAAACSATSEQRKGDPGGSGASGATGASGPGGSGASFGLDAGDDGLLSDATACAGESWSAQLAPIDMFVMLDRSGSMEQQTNQNASRWQLVTDALKGFVQQSPQTDGMGIGLQYFPILKDAKCQTDADCPPPNVMCYQGMCLPDGFTVECDPGVYAKPEVAIAPLPGNASAITASINQQGPGGSTPTAPALQGAIEHARAWGLQHPSHTPIVVFATDGEPTACDPQDIPSIAKIAADGHAGTPSVLTFVIAVDLSAQGQQDMDSIAKAGGSGQAYVVDTNQNATDQFLDALNDIQGKALACEYLIPQPKDGALDFGKVNVSYTKGGATEGEILPQVPGLSDCDAQSGGWYYDVPPPGVPSKIVMCPATCSVLKADTAGMVEILLGCKTITKDPT